MRLAISIAVALMLTAASLSAESDGARRFALVAGSNVGGKATANLRYAANDAKQFRDLLVRFGGIREEDLTLLVNPERESLQNALEFMGRKMRKAGQGKTQFVFYYSGHSDERGLLLFGEYYDYAELRAALDALGAEVRVVVLDSCSSGAFTRAKGGAILPPFLIDDSASVEGHAYITSSMEDELSQESDRIESSFFTHFLLTGLRGAADSNGDGKVSLNEAYEYAYARTLSETERTRSGAQHPSFDIRLNGIGDLVLSDLRGGGALLKLPKGLAGRLSLRDVSDKLVLEVRKADDKEMLIGVEQGYYRLTLEEESALWETTLIVDEKREYEVRRDAFTGVKAKANRTRGEKGAGFSAFPLGFSLAARDQDSSSFYLNLLGGKTRAFDGVMLTLLYGQTFEPSSGYQGALFANIGGSDFSGMQASLGANLANRDLFGLQVAPIFNSVEGNLKGLQLSAFNRAGANLMIGQLGGVNVAKGEGNFFQAGGFNISAGEIRGLQAGFVNLGNSVTGLQVGLVNYSKEQNGVQLGLVNISRELRGFPLGVIDIQLNGENHIDQVLQTAAFSLAGLDSEGLFTTTYLRFGSQYFYKYFDFGIPAPGAEMPSGYPSFFAGAGLGLRIPVFFDGFAFHLDAGANYHSPVSRLELVEDPEFLQKVVPQFRVFASMRVFKNAGLIAGLDQWVYTKHYHESPDGAGDIEILTEYGILLIDSKLFIGIQL